MKLRIGILGAGSIGRIHAEALSRHPRAAVTAVADADLARAQALAADFDARAVRDLDELLRPGIDLLVVATPNALHADAALVALDRGIAVFSEKPMATSVEDARRVLARAEAPGAFYVVGHNRRHAPVYRTVRRLIDEGFRPLLASMKMHEGDLRSPAWVSDPAVTGGFPYENLVHFFDLMEWLVAPVAEISCLARRLFIARPSLRSSSPRLDASSTLEPRRRTSGSVHAWSCSFTNPPRFPTWQPLLILIFIPVPSAVGGNAGPEVSLPSRTILAGAASRSFPPLDRARASAH